ncbi:MAG: hypothetical protein QXL01_00030 [Thermoplasmatales archaeon]
MAMSGPILADAIKVGLGFGAHATSAQNLGMANNIVMHIQSGVVNFASGTIVGIAPPSGGPLIDGAGTGGSITLVPATLELAFATTFGVLTPEISGLANAISLHVSSLGTVTFASGTITGVCTNTPLSPGVLIGSGSGGTIVGLSGAVLATAIATGIGQAAPTPQLINMATEIVNHIMGFAVVTLPSVTGTCPAGGGPIIGGAAAGGTIL